MSDKSELKTDQDFANHLSLLVKELQKHVQDSKNSVEACKEEKVTVGEVLLEVQGYAETYKKQALDMQEILRSARSKVEQDFEQIEEQLRKAQMAVESSAFKQETKLSSQFPVTQSHSPVLLKKEIDEMKRSLKAELEKDRESSESLWLVKTEKSLNLIIQKQESLLKAENSKFRTQYAEQLKTLNLLVGSTQKLHDRSFQGLLGKLEANKQGLLEKFEVNMQKLLEKFEVNEQNIAFLRSWRTRINASLERASQKIEPLILMSETNREHIHTLAGKQGQLRKALETSSRNTEVLVRNQALNHKNAVMLAQKVEERNIAIENISVRVIKAEEQLKVLFASKSKMDSLEKHQPEEQGFSRRGKEIDLVLELKQTRKQFWIILLSSFFMGAFSSILMWLILNLGR